jgi:hypothetical protein
MDARSYFVRRAEQERQRAARALTDQARRMHLELAETFEIKAASAPQGRIA